MMRFFGLLTFGRASGSLLMVLILSTPEARFELEKIAPDVADLVKNRSLYPDYRGYPAHG